MATIIEIMQLKAKSAIGDPYALYLLGQNYLFVSYRENDIDFCAGLLHV